jgi:class 3 adenylate cyclase
VETGSALASEVSLTPLLHRILERATQLTNSTDSSLILFDEKRGVLYFAHATGDHASAVLTRWGENSKEGIPLDRSKAGEVFTTGRAIIVDATRDDPKHFKDVDQETASSTKSLVCVPMKVGGKCIGVVQIRNKRSGRYSRRDLLLLEHFAPQAGIAIRNARLLADLLAHMGLYASQAKTEGLTELMAELDRPAHSEMLTVLFADLRGSTQLWHVESRPERTQHLLNEFLGMLADTVLGRQGIVNKFLGDGLMALFRGTNHAIRAVECAAAMQEDFRRLRTQWDEGSTVSLGFLDLGIGIATDTVILGSVGSLRVRDFTALGTAVNLAAHLMEHARDGRRLLVDKMTYRAAKDVVGSYEGPEPFEFRKPGQAVGHPYERYHIKSLKSGSSTERPDAASRTPGKLKGMDGRQMEALRDAFCSAFDLKTLDQMLRFRLNKDRAQLCGSGSTKKIIFELIVIAHREGWHQELIAAACEYMPNNPALKQFCHDHLV